MTVVSDVGVVTVVCSVDVVASDFVVVDCISGSFVLAAIVFVVVVGEVIVVLLVVVVGEGIVVLVLVVGEGIVVLVVIGGDVDLVVVEEVVVIGSVGKGDVDLVVDGARVGNGVSSPCTKHCTCI